MILSLLLSRPPVCLPGPVPSDAVLEQSTPDIVTWFVDDGFNVDECTAVADDLVDIDELSKVELDDLEDGVDPVVFTLIVLLFAVLVVICDIGSVFKDLYGVMLGSDTFVDDCWVATLVVELCKTVELEGDIVVFAIDME